MNLIGMKVSHTSFGSGTVIEQKDENHFTVEFSDKTSSFQYPQAFDKFLEAEDNNMQERIIEDLREKQRLDEEKKALQIAKRAEAIRAMYSADAYVEKKYVPVVRAEGAVLTFLVFQGGIFEEQSEEQYIWAPVYNAAGEHVFYWENLMNIREGDIIIHVDSGYIKAVSRAKGSWYSFDNPYDEFDNPIYKDGRRVDLEVTLLSNPIATWDFHDDIIRYCNVKYAPFDKNGNGNRGYLYDIDNKLVSIFLKEAIKNNPELNELEYIRWLLL